MPRLRDVLNAWLADVIHQRESQSVCVWPAEFIHAGAFAIFGDSSCLASLLNCDGVAGNLPAFGNVQVIREDPKNKDLLYVGTEFGLFVSLNGGKEWQKFMGNYPTVRTDDILVHPRENDLILATHGRSVWILDSISALEQMNAKAMESAVEVFNIRPAILISSSAASR